MTWQKEKENLDFLFKLAHSQALQKQGFEKAKISHLDSILSVS